jgi:uncharacterized SAM-binding protein YcdF (DUF218 family)
MKDRRSGCLRWAALVGLVLVGGTVVFNERIFLAIGNYLVIQDELQPADVIHVIAGEDYRTEHAIQLYQQGYAQTLFFTGGWCDTHQYYHGQHGKEVALAAGVPEQALAFDDSTVTSTYAEAERLKAWADQSPTPIRSLIVVSDPFHMRRAGWTYQRVFGSDVEILMAPVPAEQTPYQPRWWEDPRSQRYVRDEYQKMIYYIARYQLSWGRLNEWLFSLDEK